MGRLIDGDRLLRILEADRQYHEDIPARVDGLLDAIMVVIAAPTVNAQQWIPCSERLPEYCYIYLVTKELYGWNDKKYIAIDIAEFDENGWHKNEKVLAWMPLPEPYREETNNEM